MGGMTVNNEVEMTWKETVVANFHGWAESIIKLSQDGRTLHRE
jgi:hypothetical protein